MLARGSGPGKEEVSQAEEERIKALHGKRKLGHAKAQQELSPPLSPSLDSGSFYSASRWRIAVAPSHQGHCLMKIASFWIQSCWAGDLTFAGQLHTCIQPVSWAMPDWLCVHQHQLSRLLDIENLTFALPHFLLIPLSRHSSALAMMLLDWAHASCRSGSSKTHRNSGKLESSRRNRSGPDLSMRASGF